MSAKNYIDWNNDYNYPLQWIFESQVARNEYSWLCYRARLAMLGKPSKNIYREEMVSLLKGVRDDELDPAERDRCLNVPEGKAFAISKAVENVAGQLSSGVDSYEYNVYDPYGIIEPETNDLLAAYCKQDYINNELDSFASVFSDDLLLYGMAAVLVSYDKKSEKNIIERVRPTNIFFDTMFSSTGRERFRGYGTMISFKQLKKMIEEAGDEINTELEVPDRSIFNVNGKLDKHIKVGKKKITTLNDLEIYIQDMNKLAASPDLQAGIREWYEYDHDLRTCYNLNWYRTFATDPKARTDSGYHGDDVELTVMYDMNRKIEFKIINRRFVISANRKAFRRVINYPIYNPQTDETSFRLDEFCLGCPLKIVYSKRNIMDAAPYPISPVFPLLDLHDELCSWKAKRGHVSRILAIFRIIANGADAASLRRKFNIMGTIIDDIQGDIDSVKFAYDYSPIDSQIERIENTIKEKLRGYTEFDALQLMGDRASSAESGLANGAIAQGLAGHEKNVMSLYAQVARQCIANRVVYSNLREFPIVNRGDYSEITIQQMALTAAINVKSKLAKKALDRTLAANAITIVSGFKDWLEDDGIAYFLEQAMLGQLPRKMAQSFIKRPENNQQEIANAQLQAQNQAQMLMQNQAMYESDPLPYEVENIMQTQSPDAIDDVITQLNMQTPQGDVQETTNTELLDMPQQDGAMATGLEGQTADMGSMMANPNAMGQI